MRIWAHFQYLCFTMLQELSNGILGVQFGPNLLSTLLFQVFKTL